MTACDGPGRPAQLQQTKLLNHSWMSKLPKFQKPCEDRGGISYHPQGAVGAFAPLPEGCPWLVLSTSQSQGQLLPGAFWGWKVANSQCGHCSTAMLMAQHPLPRSGSALIWVSLRQIQSSQYPSVKSTPIIGSATLARATTSLGPSVFMAGMGGRHPACPAGRVSKSQHSPWAWLFSSLWTPRPPF